MGEQITIPFYLTRDLREAFLLLSLFRSSFKYVVNLALFLQWFSNLGKKFSRMKIPSFFVYLQLAAKTDLDSFSANGCILVEQTTA